MSQPPFCILRVSKHSSIGTLAASAQHTFRERPTPNADPALTHKNVTVGAVGAQAVAAAVRDRLQLADSRAAVKPVLCLEYLITASPEAFKQHGGKLDQQAYFNAALAWLRERHGAANVVCANLQLDETSPHLVAYVVPLVEQPGKTRKRSVIVGSNPDGTKRRETREFSEPGRVSLSASHYIGSPQQLSAMQTEFHQVVAKPHGLNRGIEGSKAKHTTIRAYYRAVNSVGRIATPQLGKLDAVKILAGEQPPAVAKLATVAAVAKAERDRLATAGRMADAKRAAEAQKQARERSKLENDRKDVERQKNALRADSARLRGQIGDMAQQVSDAEQEVGLAQAELERLQRELKAERERARQLAERLEEYEPRRPQPGLGGPKI